MTLSIRRFKKLNFGYSDAKNYKLTESPSLKLAKKRNKLEDEIYKNKIKCYEDETSTILIKLSKNIYETSIELNRINYQLKRNKLETIYKNYNYCTAHRNQAKSNYFLNKNKMQVNAVDNNNEAETKDDKLNDFLSDLSIKSENELNYLLSVDSRPKPIKEKRSYSRINSACSSNSSSSFSKIYKFDKNNNSKIDEKIKINQIKNEIERKTLEVIKESKKESIFKSQSEIKFKKNEEPSSRRVQSGFRTVNESPIKTKPEKSTRPLTSTVYSEKKFKSAPILKRSRTASLPKINYEESEIIETGEDSDDYHELDSNSNYYVRSEIKFSNNKTNNNKQPEKLVKIDDLYEKSIDNLDRIMKTKNDFNNGLDDDDWIKNLNYLKAKQREKIKANSGKFRVCSAWTADLQNRHNIELHTKIRQHQISRRLENDNLYRFDMNKEKELFELTHHNLKDLMIKKMHESEAKKRARTVQEYMQKIK